MSHTFYVPIISISRVSHVRQSLIWQREYFRAFRWLNGRTSKTKSRYSYALCYLERNHIEMMREEKEKKKSLSTADSCLNFYVRFVCDRVYSCAPRRVYIGEFSSQRFLSISFMRFIFNFHRIDRSPPLDRSHTVRSQRVLDAMKRFYNEFYRIRMILFHFLRSSSLFHSLFFFKYTLTLAVDHLNLIFR